MFDTFHLDVDLLDPAHSRQQPCTECADWGRTVTPDECYGPVPCPKCKRLTWPNLGVNLPAGCAWAVAGATAAHIQRHRALCNELLGRGKLGKST